MSYMGYLLIFFPSTNPRPSHLAIIMVERVRVVPIFSTIFLPVKMHSCQKLQTYDDSKSTVRWSKAFA